MRMSEIGDVKYVINIIIIIWATPQNRTIREKNSSKFMEIFFKTCTNTMYQGTVEFKRYSHPKIPLVPTIDFRGYVRVSKSLKCM